jgi:hypothetical protein
MTHYTDQEKFDVAARECAMRIKHYPGFVDRHIMTQMEAVYQTKVMQEIANDYMARVKGASPDLFDPLVAALTDIGCSMDRPWDDPTQHANWCVQRARSAIERDRHAKGNGGDSSH